MFTVFFKATLLFPAILLFSAGAVSGPITLNDWAFNINGNLYEYFAGDAMPGNPQLDFSGLGAVRFEFDSPGSHSLDAFFDFEFDPSANTYFNEFGQAVGVPATGQSWEIDEPGFLFGDIYDNLISSSLDNNNAIPQGSEDDVSIALGWDFDLAVGETAYLSLFTGLTAPDDIFYLSHTDPEMGTSFDQSSSLYFWGELDISGKPASIPEPSTWLLMAMGILSLFVRRRIVAP
ncbi:PEP-CTERM sorting domain-containing protein [Marinobacter sp.]|uniref:PEP-CTERM sorting domain-containing protein n=1 Tax=Marinobacter sp. TaxID=50741 RepID=UPI002B4A6F71|nr:PEP-CTERM sorting domain-containing protein [Marinobacter sp.]HKK57237.1 PEP-CTERM sorting domain-containing protein [Marinobacter sp.]